MEQEQLLFIHVVIQAIEDFITTKISPEEKLAKKQAEAWFKNNSADYKEVCSFACIDAQWLRKRVLTGDKYQLKELIDEYRQLM